MTTQNLLLYLLAVLTIGLSPGPDMLYIISQSLSHGRRLGMAAALGIAMGCFVHIFAITIGLTSLLYESAFAFSIVKYLGVGYFLYLGFAALLKKHSPLLNQNQSLIAASWRKACLQGFFTNVFNPKVALFFIAFLPQFVTATSDKAVALQLLILGLIFNGLGTLINLSVAIFFGSAQKWLQTHPKALKIQQKITGCILVGLGLRLALFEK